MIIEIRVDDELYARTAGDGLVVATPLGSSAYTMAAGGPIVLPAANAMVLTPLARHGGVSPPLVVGPESRIGLLVESGYGGSRFEVDGQALAAEALEATVGLRDDYATMITLAGQETMLAGLRRRGLVVDSPRVLVRDYARPPCRPRLGRQARVCGRIVDRTDTDGNSRRPRRSRDLSDRIELVCGARAEQSKDAGPKAC